ncbi:MAG TPA: S4 domain-containing protein, partial [Bacilli bacterium]|nr:S4 domain-containing protein [Bacilli bacterium]
MKIVISEENANNRLDVVLATITEYTRTKIATLIKNGNILVNGSKVKTGYTTRINDEIEINYVEEEITAQPEKMDLDIVYEDDDVIVVNKANGVVVHPAVG